MSCASKQVIQFILPMSHQYPYPRLQWCHAMRGNNTSIFIYVNELWATAWCVTPHLCGHMGFHKGGGCLAADLCWCDCCKSLSSLMECRAFKSSSHWGWRANKVTLNLLCGEAQPAHACMPSLSLHLRKHIHTHACMQCWCQFPLCVL